jgi:hypothetical protein
MEHYEPFKLSKYAAEPGLSSDINYTIIGWGWGGQ